MEPSRRETLNRLLNQAVVEKDSDKLWELFAAIIRLTDENEKAAKAEPEEDKVAGLSSNKIDRLSQELRDTR